MNDREFAVQVVEKLQQAGYQALWAGGCVRDSMVGKTPKDYDVATDALPEQVRDLFGYKRTLPIGQAFGVITVLGPKSANPIEVATFRRDSGYADGRRPDSVEYTNAQEDASRRDFTINGMFFDPIAEKVIDYVGGEEDLNKRQIRAIGSPHHRIEEDKLRMLRGVRFAATFAFQLEPETMAAIQMHASDIRVVSPERIGAEVRRMFTHQNRSMAVRLMIQTNLWKEILPAVVQEREQSESYWMARAAEVECLESNSFAAVLAVLFHELANKVDQGKKKPVLAPALHDVWRLKNEERDSLDWICRHAQTLHAAEQSPWSEIQPLLIHSDAAEATKVAQAMWNESDGLRLCRERLNWEPRRLNPEPLIDGADLIKLGIQPGPNFSRIIAAARALQLDGEIDTHEQAIELARAF